MKVSIKYLVLLLMMLSLVSADNRYDSFIVRIITNDLVNRDTLFAEYHRNSEAPNPDPQQMDHPIENSKLLYFNTMYGVVNDRGMIRDTDSILVSDTIFYAGEIPFATIRKICIRDYYSIEIDSVLTTDYYLDFQWVDSITTDFLSTQSPIYYYESNLISCDIGGGLSVKVCSYDSLWTLDYFNLQFSYPNLERVIPIDAEDSTYGLQFQMLDDRYEFCSYDYFWKNLPETVKIAIKERKIFIVPLMGI